MPYHDIIICAGSDVGKMALSISCTGKVAAIQDVILERSSRNGVSFNRKAERGYEYLQLQDSIGSGYRKLDTKVLTTIFKCKKKRTFYGVTVTSSSMLFDIDDLKNNEDFVRLSGYINNSRK